MKHFIREPQIGFASRAVSLSSRQRLFPEAQHNFTPRKASHTLCKEFTVGFLKYCVIGRMKHVSDVSHDTKRYWKKGR